MEPRMTNPVMTVPGVMKTLLTLGAAMQNGGLPKKTALIAHLRASQINGCSFCANMHAQELKQLGETDERLFTVAAWREAPWFTDAERAALALTEAATRLADKSDAVPDDIWENAKKHFDEKALGDLVLNIAMINFWNRVNVMTGMVAGPLPQH